MCEGPSPSKEFCTGVHLFETEPREENLTHYLLYTFTFDSFQYTPGRVDKRCQYSVCQVTDR